MTEPETVPTKGEIIRYLVRELGKYDPTSLAVEIEVFGKSANEINAINKSERVRIINRLRVIGGVFPDFLEAAKNYYLTEVDLLASSNDVSRRVNQTKLNNIRLRYTDVEETPVFDIALEEFRYLESLSY